MRVQLTGIFPGLERSLDLTNTGGLLTLLNGHQTPAAIHRDRRPGRRRTSLPGEGLAAQISRHASGTITPFK
ncbi:hypothetical protein ACFY3M_41435 [Streptomyces mirabilis]|uniref:hypothetical protein n=1 Tax=Streptomyces mirabilis TaxID=68239 RepID=UPI003683D718